jgi:hypothetical protein
MHETDTVAFLLGIILREREHGGSILEEGRISGHGLGIPDGTE